MRGIKEYIAALLHLFFPPPPLTTFASVATRAPLSMVPLVLESVRNTSLLSLLIVQCVDEMYVLPEITWSHSTRRG